MLSMTKSSNKQRNFPIGAVKLSKKLIIWCYNEMLVLYFILSKKIQNILFDLFIVYFVNIRFPLVQRQHPIEIHILLWHISFYISGF